MADSSSDHIVVSCSCGAKLRVAATSIGRKTKCPKCESVISITAPDETEGTTKQPVSSPPSSPPDDDMCSLLDNVAMHGQSADANTGKPCPGCETTMQTEASVCAACGFDAEKGVTQKTPLLPNRPTEGETVKQLAKRAGTFILGCTLSGIGAVVGAGIWCLVAVVIGYEFIWIAAGIGILTGIGMSLGYRKGSTTAGVVAAGIAIFGVVLGKALIFAFLIFTAVLDSTSDANLRRQYVIIRTAGEILEERGIDADNPTTQEWELARNEAERRMATMFDEEVERQWQEYQDADALLAEEESLAMEQSPDEYQRTVTKEDAYGQTGPAMSDAAESLPLGELLTVFFNEMFGVLDFFAGLVTVILAFSIGRSSKTA